MQKIKLGILGGGQLAMMLAEAAPKLNIETLCFESFENCSASHASAVMLGEINDNQAIDKFLTQVDCLTLENENIPLSLARRIEAQKSLLPNSTALYHAQDRLYEKQLFEKLQIPVAPHQAVDTYEDLLGASKTLGLPLILKTRTLGYDGKGQRFIKAPNEIEDAWDALKNRPLIAERVVNFSEEVSLIAARGHKGEVVFYPLTQNTHKNGILVKSLAPYTDLKLWNEAKSMIQAVMEALDYVGTLTIEFFLEDHQLVANEMAPRVHNSGHWTIEGTDCSQFENHLRAVCGLPLIPPQVKNHTVMLNCLGSLDPKALHARFPKAVIHDYYKDPRPLRKVGHLCLKDLDKVEAEGIKPL